MKPRFSILFILAFTAFIALNAVSLAQPDSNWRYGPFLVWIGAMLWAITEIATPDLRNSRRGAFSIGFVLTGLTYSVASWAEYDFPSGIKVLGQFTPRMPHWYVFAALLELRRTPMDPNNLQNALDAHFGINLLAITNTLLLAGIIGGLLCVWRFHSHERRSMP